MKRLRVACAVLVTLPALGSWLPTQHWEWNANPLVDGVTAYNVYWSANANQWCATQVVTFDAATSCGMAAGCSDDQHCCGDVPEPAFSPAYFDVIAVNASGEGRSQHGGFVPCP